MLLTWFGAIVLPAALAEFFFGNGVPAFWRKARWVAMPAIGIYSGITVPLGLLDRAPVMDLLLSVVAATVVAFMVAVAGFFMIRFKRHLTARELAKTGRRSAILAGAPMELRKVRPAPASKHAPPAAWSPRRS